MKYLDVNGIGKVSRIGLGTWQFGSHEWGYGDSYASGAARDIVQRALALGITLFDTAEVHPSLLHRTGSREARPSLARVVVDAGLTQA
jgi:aryl-alcohol dehydrogenase-like predicted oxidoreductase